tara:strand:+ start:95 stop:319 length:225 start_codon:yes stop_codon:yes gene_type:complete
MVFVCGRWVDKIYLAMKLTIILTTIGAAAGFAYASLLGCDSVCSIASSSLNTTVYGAFAGLVLAFPINKKFKNK